MALVQADLFIIGQALKIACSTCRATMGLHGNPSSPGNAETCPFCDSTNFPIGSVATTAHPQKQRPTSSH